MAAVVGSEMTTKRFYKSSGKSFTETGLWVKEPFKEYLIEEVMTKMARLIEHEILERDSSNGAA